MKKKFIVLNLIILDCIILNQTLDFNFLSNFLSNSSIY